MLPDPDTCFRAYESRDARFDGRFFTAVVSTGIYCRPICPARTPLRRNVRFFAHPAAAEQAGFRACRRCRPEAAPGSPAWAGTSGTVARGLRLIEEGYLDTHPAPALAARLGVGERHLRRLFEAHLGVAPAQVARTRRLHFARTLVETSTLPISELAQAAGFRSLRQFNDAFRQTFAQAPTQLRRAEPALEAVHPRACDTGGCRLCAGARALTLRLSYRPPLDWPGMLAFFAARALPGVEAVDQGRYVRSFRLDGATGWFSVREGEAPHTLLLEVHGASARMLLPLVRRVRRLFDLDADPAAIAEVLGRSPLLRASVRKRGGLRVASAFALFEGAVRIVVGQQVSVSAARTVLGRLCAQAGEPVVGAPLGITRTFALPDALASLAPAQLGMPVARGRTLVEVAKLASEGRPLELEAVEQLPGIGPWTRSLLRMRADGDPDAFPGGDLALRRVCPGLSAAQLERTAEAWRPWRAYAAMHLWAMDSEQHLRAQGRMDHVRAVAT